MMHGAYKIKKEMAVCKTTTFRSSLDFSGEQGKNGEVLLYPTVEEVTLKPIFLYGDTTEQIFFI